MYIIGLARRLVRVHLVLSLRAPIYSIISKSQSNLYEPSKGVCSGSYLIIRRNQERAMPPNYETNIEHTRYSWDAVSLFVRPKHGISFTDLYSQLAYLMCTISGKKAFITSSSSTYSAPHSKTYSITATGGFQRRQW